MMKQAGALELQSGELKFELDTNTQLPTNVFKYETVFTNNLIEERIKMALHFESIMLNMLMLDDV